MKTACIGFAVAFCLTPGAFAQTVPSTSFAFGRSASSQAEILGLITKKLSQPLSTPRLLPGQNSIAWLESHRPLDDKDKTAAWRFVGETLLLSQILVTNKNQKTRKAGFLMACETANFIGARMSDEKTLLAEVYSDFILPDIHLSNVES